MAPSDRRPLSYTLEPYELLEPDGRMLSFGMASGEWADISVEAAPDRGVVIQDVAADVLCVVEAENRPSLDRFSQERLLDADGNERTTRNTGRGGR